jgi:hypothetical protein
VNIQIYFLVENREVDRLSLFPWLVAATLGFHMNGAAVSGLQMHTIDPLMFPSERNVSKVWEKCSCGGLQ